MSAEIRTFESFDAFAHHCQSALMRDECRNNVILGTCHRFRHQPTDVSKYHFMAAIGEDETIISCSLTTPTKTYVTTFIEQIDAAVKPLADYFDCHRMKLRGVAGEMTTVRRFLDFYPQPILQSKTLLLNVLETLQSVELVPESELTLAKLDDLAVLTVWAKNFLLDADLLPPRSDEELRTMVKEKIDQKRLYTLTSSSEKAALSMAAVTRETEHFAFLSWVYTPADQRGRGYASTTVYRLTELVLRMKKKRCALFSDASNSTSNKIYRRIGYQPLGNFFDVDFEEKNH